jgi:hypothetical protein
VAAVLFVGLFEGIEGDGGFPLASPVKSFAVCLFRLRVGWTLRLLGFDSGDPKQKDGQENNGTAHDRFPSRKASYHGFPEAGMARLLPEIARTEKFVRATADLWQSVVDEI